MDATVCTLCGCRGFHGFSCPTTLTTREERIMHAALLYGTYGNDPYTVKLCTKAGIDAGEQLEGAALAIQRENASRALRTQRLLKGRVA